MSKFFNKDIENLISLKFGAYSKYIIQERALPDIRDGLKPVQRRILYAMNDIKLFHNSPYKKSARVVGDVIGKYHPHGDTSVYDAIVRMAQDWKMSIPLVDMHGNKGSIDGDSPAAMRYTEIRLSKISEYLLKDLEKKITPFTLNFDDSEIEPTILPSRIPNILINGSTGIASGYSTNIPPHNLSEVIKAIIYLLNNDETKISDILKIIKGPDFPTGGILYDKKLIKEAYLNGKGKVTIRSTYTYSKNKNEIYITEIPYEVSKSSIVKKIDELINKGTLNTVDEVRDDSDRSGLQITLVLKKSTDGEAIMNYLFKSTDLEKNFNFNLISIKDGSPQLLNIQEILESFVEFQFKIYKTLFKYKLDKANKRLEIVDGLIKVVSIIDKVIKVIKDSKNKQDAKKNIIEKFKFSENQSEAIVQLRLYRLTSTDINELTQEQDKLVKNISHYKKALDNKNYLIKIMVNEYEEIIEKFNIKRRSKIMSVYEQSKVEETDLIQEEKVIIVLSQEGYIKRVSQKSKNLSTEKETGKNENDIIISENITSNLNNVVIFSSNGKYYNIPIYKLNEFKWREIGEHLSKYFNFNIENRIIGVAYLNKNKEYDNCEIIVSTKFNQLKRIKVSDLSFNINKVGSKFISLPEGDEVVSLSSFINEDEKGYTLTLTKNGLISRYDLKNIPQIGLNSKGSMNVKLQSNDSIVGTKYYFSLEKNSQIICLTTNGKAKRFRISEIKETKRPSVGTLIALQSKSNPYQIVNVFDPEKQPEINLLLLDKNSLKKLKTKTDVLLSNFNSGLNKVTKSNVIKAVGDLTLKFIQATNKHESNFEEGDTSVMDFQIKSLLDDL